MHKPCILIVEDDSALRRLYVLTLMDEFDVRSAINGVEALNCLGEGKPDVVLTDIQMPVMDGIELLECIRRNVELSGLPVIVLSACDKKYLQQAEVAGATKIIEKPIDPDDLFEEVWRVLPAKDACTKRAG
jgi:CheY-like chemotaxis protein